MNLLVINILATYHMRKVGIIRTWKRSVMGPASGTKNHHFLKKVNVCLSVCDVLSSLLKVTLWYKARR